MAEISLDPAIAEVSPNLYKAALDANLPADQKTMVAQMARTYKTAKSLLKVSEEEARKEFQKFDPIIQENIRFLFPDQKRFTPEPGFFGKAIETTGAAIGDILKFSPIVALFTAADKYYKGLNTPYNTQAQVRQGKRFDKKLLSDAFDGKNSWKWDKVTEYENKYGTALTTLARGIIEARTPGESVALYSGGMNEEMLSAMRFMGDEPEKFQSIMDELALYAQVSPGRDAVGTWAKADEKVNDNYWANKLLKSIGMDLNDPKNRIVAGKLTSGTVDATYQVGIDPLTYTGIGPIIKGVKAIGRGIAGVPEAVTRFGGIKRRGERLADQFLYLAEKGNVEGGVDFVFKQPEVVKLWDEQLGVAVKNYAEADGAFAKNIAYKKITKDFPDWANLEVVKNLAKQEVFDAKGAKKFFIEHDDFGLLITGRVDNSSFRRNGISVAREHRTLQSALQRSVDAVFSPQPKNLDVQSYIRQGEEKAQSAMDVLKRVADEGENLVNPAIADIIDIKTSISGIRKALNKLSVAFTVQPGRILVGEDAIKTSEDFRNLAKSVFSNKDIAGALTELFLKESPEVQLTIVRNLYAATMLKTGMHGAPTGEKVMNEILSATFNETGMFSTTKSEVPVELAGLFHPASLRREGEIFVQSSKGIVQPSQVAFSIAPLPYDLIYQTAASSRLSERINFMNLFGGVTRNRYAKAITDFWANHTLFPRLGIRSAIDEAFFFFITAPTTAVREFVTGGRQGRKALETATGSKTAQGMYKRGLFYPGKSGKILDKVPYKIPSILPSLDPTKRLSAQDRLDILESARVKMSKKYGYEVALSDVAHEAIREETILRVIDIYGDRLNPSTIKTIKRLMKHSPNVLDSVANSVGARSMMTGQIELDYIDTVFSPSRLTQGIKDAGLVLGKKYRELQAEAMTTTQLAIAHFDNWNIRFAYNSEKIAKGARVNPVNAFFFHNGLRTEGDIVKARHSVLKDVGVERVPGGFDDDYLVASEDKLNGFLSLFSTTVWYRQRGIPDAQIARIHAETMLMDMKNTFHGGPTLFNEGLFNEVKASKKRLEEAALESKKELRDTWSRASAEIDFAKFEELTQGFQPKGNVRTRVYNMGDAKDMKIFEEGEGFPYLYSKWSNWTMDVMDAQVTGLYRQPALMVFTEKALKDFAPYEKLFTERYTAAALRENPLLSPSIARTRAKAQAEKQVTELALKRATDELLEYVDNPAIRSNLATSIRSVGRFYRATEDFYRRSWRLYTKNPLRTLYRTRLLHTGLEANGDVFEDERGDKFIVFPTDSIINGAIEPVLRTLTGNSGLQIPTFNEFTLKLRLINPSFSPDAAQPALAGPIAGVSVVTLRAFLRELPLVPGFIKDKIQPTTIQAGETLDTIALGQFGDRMTFRSAIMPLLADSIWSTLSPAEKDRQKATAVLQAITYHQAFGNGLPTDATAEERNDYLGMLRRSANGIINARNMLGQMSPGQPTLRDSQGLPDFMKRTGITSWKASFWDTYNSIIANGGDDIGDAFDVAIATWVGKNPGKVAYLVPRNTKEFRVLIATTDAVKDWSIKNSKFLDQYGEVGYLFAPKSGEYNPDIYGWMQSEGLVDIPDFKKYLDSVQVAEDKQRYFQIEDELNESLRKNSTNDARRILIDRAQKARQSLLQSNPLLDAEIGGSGTNRGNLRVMFKELSEAIANPNSPIKKETRSLMNLAVRQVSDFLVLAEDEEQKRRFDFSEIKADRKQKVMNILTELGKQSPEVKEANRIIFTGLLNYYSRESIMAGTGGR
jgi:hypothetical protein